MSDPNGTAAAPGAASDPVRAMLEAGLLPATRFGPSSRYAGIGVDALAGDDPEDPPVPYLRRRLVPGPDRFAEQYRVRVIEGDRRDNLADAHVGSVELWWRLADSNGALDPRELTDEAGSMLRITTAVDVPGPEAVDG
jgi:hypothetical protein